MLRFNIVLNEDASGKSTYEMLQTPSDLERIQGCGEDHVAANVQLAGSIPSTFATVCFKEYLDTSSKCSTMKICQVWFIRDEGRRSPSDTG
ncbi:hypothetical protein WN55_11270 [Dufourea novaeangliae]|uniref:Uncharacterized protein n=1 Tax=Dufourea novaeangliae TaxID=178035 RepID=A0A154P9P4_DUFNO|nr:hypothetical protein WN55_11270 [Dufourea novaeangliae]